MKRPRSVCLPLALLTAATALAQTSPRSDRSVPSAWSYSHSVLKPVNLFGVRLANGFWRPRIDTNVRTGWHDLGEKLEAAGHIEPFRIIAEGRAEMGQRELSNTR